MYPRSFKIGPSFGTGLFAPNYSHGASTANCLLLLHFKIRKIFPVYERKPTQCYLIQFGKCFRIPIGPESCCVRSEGGCGSVVGNIATTGRSMVIGAGNYHKSSLFSSQHRTTPGMRIRVRMYAISLCQVWSILISFWGSGWRYPNTLQEKIREGIRPSIPQPLATW